MILLPTSPDANHLISANGAPSGPRLRILCLFGTRPETIKFAPVIHALEKAGHEPVNVTSAQHRDLLYPLVKLFNLRLDHDLGVMKPGQSLNHVLSRVVEALDPLLVSLAPDAILVQGDTTTALAGALAGWNRRIPVGHIEAGLRSGDAHSPYPEEMNRRVISQMATWHFAATERNRRTLLDEGVSAAAVHVTGNPLIDALHWTLKNLEPSPEAGKLLGELAGERFILLTTHRRESFGQVMRSNLEVLRDFIHAHRNVSLVFPVHPNPEVKAVAASVFQNSPRVRLIDPLPYQDFLHLASRAHLLVSDSGGVQEEAPSLRRPLIVLRENTERPEAVDCGAARLIGNDPEALRASLENAWLSDSWHQQLSTLSNPYGDGRSAERIASILAVPLAV